MYTGTGHDASNDILAMGPLVKRGAYNTGWKRRWFVLRPLPNIAGAVLAEKAAIVAAAAAVQQSPTASIPQRAAAAASNGGGTVPIFADGREEASPSPAATDADAIGFDDDEDDDDEEEEDYDAEAAAVAAAAAAAVGSPYAASSAPSASPSAASAPPTLTSAIAAAWRPPFGGKSVSSTDAVAVLSYYGSAHDALPKGSVNLTPLMCRRCAALSVRDGTDPKGRTDGKEHCFFVRVPGRKMYLAALSGEDKERWLAAIKSCIPHHMRTAGQLQLGAGAGGQLQNGTGVGAVPPHMRAAVGAVAGSGGGGSINGSGGGGRAAAVADFDDDNSDGDDEDD